MNRRTILSAGIVVVRNAATQPRLLLLRAFRNWDFPKGEVEPGETPLAAARRETFEETGLADLEFHWGEAWSETLPYGRGKVARYYLAESVSGEPVLPVNPALGRPEHHEFRWVEPATARHLLPPRLQPILTWALARLAGPAEPPTG